MTRVISPEARLSYPHLLVPRQDLDDKGQSKGDPKYSALLIFEPGTDVSGVRAAIVEVIVGTFGAEKAKEVLLKMQPGGSVWNPLRQDIEKKYGEGQHYFLNTKDFRKPLVVHPNLTRMTDVEIGAKMYPGACVRASLVFKWYDNTSKGVRVELKNLQWLKDGERLDNQIAPENEFEAMPDAAASDLASLMG